MKTFTEYLSETTSTTPPPQFGPITGDEKNWAQDKLSSCIQWHQDQINSLDTYANKEQLQDHQQAITTLRQYVK